MVTYEEVVEAFVKIKEFCSERNCNECKFDSNKHYYCKLLDAIGNPEDIIPEDWNLEHLKIKLKH